MKQACRLVLLAFLLVSVSSFGADLNPLVVKTIGEMPQGGRYARYSKEHQFLELHQTVVDLNESLGVRLGGRGLKVRPEAASRYSFCSSATYLLFARVIEKLQKTGAIQIDPSVNREIADVGSKTDVISGQNDGVGIFGHWNADGPGTAVLFERLNLGSNFVDYEKALPGDFMKIFWNDRIGKGERGHLVVFLGHHPDHSSVLVWSSNLKNEDGSSGYGRMLVDKSRIERVVFSRLERPENLNRWKRFSEAEKRSEYLIEIRKSGSTFAEMKRVTGIVE